MAQLIVRNIDKAIKRALQERARRKGRSMEAEVREILREAVEFPPAPGAGLGSAISGRFRDIGLDEAIREHGGSSPKEAEWTE